jgi:hypothetical protein
MSKPNQPAAARRFDVFVVEDYTRDGGREGELDPHRRRLREQGRQGLQRATERAAGQRQAGAPRSRAAAGSLRALVFDRGRKAPIFDGAVPMARLSGDTSQPTLKRHTAGAAVIRYSRIANIKSRP